MRRKPRAATSLKRQSDLGRLADAGPFLLFGHSFLVGQFLVEASMGASPHRRSAPIPPEYFWPKKIGVRVLPVRGQAHRNPQAEFARRDQWV